MSKKRHFKSVGSLSYSKLPRLEAEAGPRILGTSLCQSSALPSYPLDNHYGYKQSYLNYSLQYQEGLKSYWASTSEATYGTYGTRNPANQQLQAEKAFYPLYPRAQGQPIGKEKNGECVSQETLSAPERWASWTGYPEFSSQGWIHGHVAQQTPRVPAYCPNLAVPMPVYQNHVYSAESGYIPKALGIQVESTPKPSLGTEWTPPPSGYPDCTENPSNSTGVMKTATAAKSSFPPGPKHSAMNPPGFLPYHKAYDKGQGDLSGSFMEISYPVVCNTQKNVPEAHGGSPSKYMWSKQPPPPVSPLAHPISMMHQDRSSACYALPPYPLTTHEQMLLYHQNFTQAEKMNSLFSLPICKGFGSLGCEDPQLLSPGSYFPQTHENYYPNLLDRYLYRTAGPPVISPGLLSSRQPEHQQNSKADMEKPPNLACAASEKTSYGSSLPRNRGVQDCLEGGQAVDSVTNKSFPNQCPAPKPQPSQPLHPLKQSPVSFSRSGQMQGTGDGDGDGSSHSEKVRVRDEKQAHPSKPSLLTPDTKKRHGDSHKTETGACVIISDSLRTHLNSPAKGDQSINVPDDSSSPEERTQGVDKIPERPPPPPSPPMPIINNVFSLAPYRDYIEGTSNTVDLALSNSYRSEDAFPSNVGQKVESQGSWQRDCTRLSESSQVPSTVKGTCSGTADISGNSGDMEDSARASESVVGKHFPAVVSVSSRGGVSNRTGETERETPVLEPGCKMEDVLEVPPEKKGEATERENSQSKEEELKEGPPSKRDTLLETSWKTSELPLKSGPEGKSHFQSSAAFLFKKFRILKSHAASLGSAAQETSSLQFQPIGAKTLVLSNDSSPQPGSGQVVPQQGSSGYLESPSQVAVQQNASPVPGKKHHGATQQNRSLAQHSPHQWVTLRSGLVIQQPPRKESTHRNRSPVQQSSCQAATHQSGSPVEQSAHQPLTLKVSSPVQQSLHQVTAHQSNSPVQQSAHQPLTLKVSSPVQRSFHQAETHQSRSPVQQSAHQPLTLKVSSPVQQSHHHVMAHQSSPPVQQSAHQPLTLKVSSPVQRSFHQAEAHQSSSPLQQSAHQPLTLKVSSPVQQSLHQTETHQSNSPPWQSADQPLTLQVSSPVQRSPHQVTAQQTSPSVQPDLPEAASQPEAQFLHLTFFTAKPSDTSKVLPPSTPARSPVLGEAKILVPSKSESHGQQHSTEQYFTALHNSICTTISCSVTTSSLEQLQEWLKKAESPAEPKEKVVSLAKHKNRLKASSGLPKLSNGKQIWLAFKDVATLFRKLLSQLDTFLLTRKCPFPHVVRAGAIFIPIHVVKEKLFPNLSSASVDHVLQDHKVELRPTTLSEEKLLRDLELKSCTSRMLKLLALKQLPDIYPDLLTLQWHECVKQHLGDTAGKIPNTNALAADGSKLWNATKCLQDTSSGFFEQNIQRNSTPGRKCELARRDKSTGMPNKIGQRAGDETSQGPTLPLFGKGAPLKGAKLSTRETTTVSMAPKAKGAKRQKLSTYKLPRTLQVKLTSKVARKIASPSKVHQLRKPVVRIKFQNAVQDIRDPLGFNTMGKKGGKAASRL